MRDRRYLQNAAEERDNYKMKSKKPEIHEYARLNFEFNSESKDNNSNVQFLISLVVCQCIYSVYTIDHLTIYLLKVGVELLILCVRISRILLNT